MTLCNSVAKGYAKSDFHFRDHHDDDMVNDIVDELIEQYEGTGIAVHYCERGDQLTFLVSQ